MSGAPTSAFSMRVVRGCRPMERVVGWHNISSTSRPSDHDALDLLRVLKHTPVRQVCGDPHRAERAAARERREPRGCQPAA